MADMRWLERRGRTWYAVQDVPRPLQAAMGRRRMLKSLHTRDHHVAVARRYAALAEFQAAFAACRRIESPAPGVEPGLEWLATRTAIERGDPKVVAFWERQFNPHLWEEDPKDPRKRAMEVAEWVLDIDSGDIRNKLGDAAADTFRGIALGRAIPLLHFVPAWLAEGGVKGPLTERTQQQYRADLRAFERWAMANDVPPTIQAVDRRTAGRYVTSGLLGNGVDRVTANRKITAASSYWRWLVKRDHAEFNPWERQSLSKAARPHEGDTRKRPFTDTEVATLLAGPADPELADAMRFAALSGMRIEEAYRLTVADCARGLFHIRAAKTRAGARRVPIHTELTALVARRVADKSSGNYLFAEPGPAKAGRGRSMPTVKRFGHYRRRMGVDDAVAGRRQSRVDLHSFRRWFITTAREAGIDRAVVAAVVGHEVGNLTDDTYSGGPSEARRRACVEAVRLPTAPQDNAGAPSDNETSPSDPPRSRRSRRAPSRPSP